jgi:hypothetical protein
VAKERVGSLVESGINVDSIGDLTNVEGFLVLGNLLERQKIVVREQNV